MRKISLFIILFSASLWVQIAGFSNETKMNDGEWHYYSRDFKGSRYSPLDQINKENVQNLKRAWVYRTGDIAPDGVHYFECTPLVVNGVMYVITTFSRAVALDATTGEEVWVFDPELDLKKGSGALASRGVSYWKSGEKERIFLPVRDGRLYSLDAKTGKPDRSFGDHGFVDLRERLAPGGVRLFLSSPPAIYKDIVIQGFGMPDGANPKLQHVPLMALNAHTGETAWTFNTIPLEGEFGADTWDESSYFDRGGGNVWTIMSMDRDRGILYLPVSAPNFDFYGGERLGDNLFSNSIVALDAATGLRIWHFQTVHHDVWDYDLPAQPNLVDLNIKGKKIPAVAQLGKTGFIYVLNRLTGEPIFPIEERPVPPSDAPGEVTSKTQPFPLLPPPIARQGLTEEDLSDLDEETHRFVIEKFREFRSDGLFTPPSIRGSIVNPGFHGGANWSGGAVDPNGMMYVNTTELPCYTALIETPEGPFPYKHSGWLRFRDQNGYPGVKPPWGQLVKVDLNEGAIVWEKPLGEFDELTERGIPITGQENFGGATVTADGLVFIASTPDERIRAFDAETGEVVWQEKMEAAGYAAPVSYLDKEGKHYIVICAGGGAKINTPKGDYIIAFSLE